MKIGIHKLYKYICNGLIYRYVDLVRILCIICVWHVLLVKGLSIYRKRCYDIGLYIPIALTCLVLGVVHNHLIPNSVWCPTQQMFGLGCVLYLCDSLWSPMYHVTQLLYLNIKVIVLQGIQGMASTHIYIPASAKWLSTNVMYIVCNVM